MHTRVYTSVIPEMAFFIAPGSRSENWNKQIYEDKHPVKAIRHASLTTPVSVHTYISWVVPASSYFDKLLPTPPFILQLEQSALHTVLRFFAFAHSDLLILQNAGVPAFKSRFSACESALIGTRLKMVAGWRKWLSSWTQLLAACFPSDYYQE